MIIVRMRLFIIIEYDALRKREKQEWPFAEVSESVMYLDLSRETRIYVSSHAAVAMRCRRLSSIKMIASTGACREHGGLSSDRLDAWQRVNSGRCVGATPSVFRQAVRGDALSALLLKGHEMSAV